jgi:hypothetical protein
VYLKGGTMSERLFKASQWREAKAEHKRQCPEPGDYWYVDHFCPLLVVVTVLADFVLVCRNVQDAGDNCWTWDLSKLDTLPREEFGELVTEAFLGEKHNWVPERLNRRQ